jgi:hypothetical protein
MEVVLERDQVVQVVLIQAAVAVVQDTIKLVVLVDLVS